MKTAAGHAVASGLLAFLRARIDADDVAFADTPERFEAGVESSVFGFRLAGATGAFSQPLVLRLYGAHVPGTRVRFESALQNGVADLGYPAPRVLLACETAGELGGPFVIMERVPGTLLLEPFTRRGTSLVAAMRSLRTALYRTPAILADLGVALHQLDAEPVVRRLESAGFPRGRLRLEEHLDRMDKRIEEAALDGLRPGMRWLFDHRPSEPARLSLCHGDLWIGNVLMEAGRVTGVIDWSMSMAMLADPAYDVAVTNIGLLRGVADLPGPLQPVARWVQRGVSRRYLGAYRRRRPVDAAATGYYELLRCMDMLSAVGERRAGMAGAIRPDGGPNMLDLAGSMDGYVAHFLETTGIRLTLPPARGRP